MSTKIPWCNEVLNVTAGCTKCSPGCLNCYAERMAKRLACMGKEGYCHVTTREGKWNGKIYHLFNNRLDKPLHWKKPRRIFINSMSDLFHPKVPFEFIDKVLYVMYRNLQHTFLILTKRPKVMLEYFTDDGLLLRLLRLFPNYTPKKRLCREWPLDNVHLGVSISNQAEADENIPILLQIPAAVRWLSIEPLLSKINLTAWLKADTLGIKKEKQNERKRTDVSEPSGIGRVQYRQSRPNMETQVLVGRKSYRDRGAISKSAEIKKGGASNLPSTLTDNVHSQPEKICDICSQGSLDDVSSTANPRLFRDKPQGWQPGKQQSRKSRIGDTPTEHSSRRQDFEGDGQKGTARGKECDGETDTTRCGCNKATMQEQEPAAGRNSKDVRGGSKSNIKNTPQQKLGGVIVGGEFGPGARPMQLDWPRNIRDQCVAAGVPFYFKQWGAWGIWEPIPNDPQKRLRIVGKSEPLSPKTILKIFPENAGCTIPFTGWAKVGKKKAGDLLDGRKWKQLPK